MVSKSALEQAEMLATADRLAENQAKKEQSAEERRGFFMLLFAIVWGIIKFFLKIIFAILKKSSSGNSYDIRDLNRIK